jgi:hypothetical protein
MNPHPGNCKKQIETKVMHKCRGSREYIAETGGGTQFNRKKKGKEKEESRKQKVKR